MARLAPQGADRVLGVAADVVRVAAIAVVVELLEVVPARQRRLLDHAQPRGRDVGLQRGGNLLLILGHVHQGGAHVRGVHVHFVGVDPDFGLIHQAGPGRRLGDLTRVFTICRCPSLNC